MGATGSGRFSQSKRNGSLERQVLAYPKWKYYKLAIAYCATKSMGKSEAFNKIIENFFEINFTEYQRSQLLHLYNDMTEEQRKNPSKYWDLKTDTSKPNNMIYQATIKATGETIAVYRLKPSGNYYDYHNMGAHMPPSAPKAGKKEFTPNELIVGKQIDPDKK